MTNTWCLPSAGTLCGRRNQGVDVGVALLTIALCGPPGKTVLPEALTPGTIGLDPWHPEELPPGLRAGVPSHVQRQVPPRDQQGETVVTIPHGSSACAVTLGPEAVLSSWVVHWDIS